MARRTPHQDAAIGKFNAALEAAIGKRDIESMSGADMDDVIAAALGALSPHDVAAFWLPGAPGEWSDFPPAPGRTADGEAKVVTLPAIRAVREVDLARQPSAEGRSDVIHLRRREK